MIPRLEFPSVASLEQVSNLMKTISNCGAGVDDQSC